ncbi:effector-associated domain EAD1-containing protein [Frankia sp. QA3]|uniref:effector-associated domain EAD1-containing protein n=1 Tax=Frankia sp. QA3 TaxID=710111 RepID=UPI00350FACE3
MVRLVDGLSDGEVRALASAFPDKVSARHVLVAAGLEVGRHPVLNLHTAEEMWREMWREVSALLENGALLDDRRALFVAVRCCPTSSTPVLLWPHATEPCGARTEANPPPARPNRRRGEPSLMWYQLQRQCCTAAARLGPGRYVERPGPRVLFGFLRQLPGGSLTLAAGCQGFHRAACRCPSGSRAAPTI